MNPTNTGATNGSNRRDLRTAIDKNRHNFCPICNQYVAPGDIAHGVRFKEQAYHYPCLESIPLGKHLNGYTVPILGLVDYCKELNSMSLITGSPEETEFKILRDIPIIKAIAKI